MGVLLLAVAIAAGLCAQPVPLLKATPADIARGQRLYGSNCAGCHGMDGSGGSGPALTRARFRRATDDEALIGLITEGIATSGMPPSWHLLPDGPRQIAAYVRSLGAVGEAAPPGNVQHGRELFASRGCGGCHIVQGQGTGLGPELTGIGARRTVAALKQALTNPGEAITAASLPVRVETREGKQLLGIRVNEDSFTLQLKDARGQFHSFRKADLAAIDKQFGKSLMPSFGALPATDLQDLIAFLASLKGDE